MKKLVKVHMLPTEEGRLVQMNNTKELHYCNSIKTKQQCISCNHTAQHLYFTSDEEIKNGDKFLNIISKNIFTNDSGESIPKSNSEFKIIATSDKSLFTKELKADNEEGIFGGYYYLKNGRAEYITKKDFKKKFSLPKTPKEFVKEYCDKGGIDEVMVEYERYWKVGISESNTGWDYKLKINQDNTINIFPVEEKLYTAKEVKKLIWKMEGGVLSETQLTFINKYLR